MSELAPHLELYTQGLMNKIVKGPLAPMPTDYSPEWRTLVRNMLLKNPDERPDLEVGLRNRGSDWSTLYN